MMSFTALSCPALPLSPCVAHVVQRAATAAVAAAEAEVRRVWDGTARAERRRGGYAAALCSILPCWAVRRLQLLELLAGAAANGKLSQVHNGQLQERCPAVAAEPPQDIQSRHTCKMRRWRATRRCGRAGLRGRDGKGLSDLLAVAEGDGPQLPAPRRP